MEIVYEKYKWGFQTSPSMEFALDFHIVGTLKSTLFQSDTLEHQIRG